MTGRVRTAALLTVVLIVSGAGGACGPRSNLEHHQDDGPDPWLAQAGGRHRTADLRLEAGDVTGAQAMLRAIVAPDASERALNTARRLVLQDTYFRLARLALESDGGREALTYADAGLALGTAPHLFVANLLVARGAAHEALGNDRAAAEDYHRALVMNESLLEEALRSQ